jgi:hypothetical protein
MLLWHLRQPSALGVSGEGAVAGVEGGNGEATGVAVGAGVGNMPRLSANVSRFQSAAVIMHTKSRMTKILIRDLVIRFEAISIRTWSLLWFFFVRFVYFVVWVLCVALRDLLFR